MTDKRGAVNTEDVGVVLRRFQDVPGCSRMRLFQNGFKFRICNLRTEAEVLRLYLAINAGGTPHTEEELNRVRRMLEERT